LPDLWLKLGMQKHLRRLKRGQFTAWFHQLIPGRALRALWRQSHPSARRGRKLSGQQCATALVYHGLRRQGSVSHHVKELFGIDISDSALTQRRARLPWEIFSRLLELALRPLAQPRRHQAAFYHGLRLVGIDGTQWSVRNTPRILGALSKAAARRLNAAFAKIGLVVLTELGMHNPLAAAIGKEGESEAALARRVMRALPEQCLLLGDRLYGTAQWVIEWWELGRARRSHVLVRVRRNLKARVLEVLGDGSALVELIGGDESGRKVRVTAREIRGKVLGRGGKVTVVRLWTSLLDAEKHPAGELIALYAQRWEAELSYRELKIEMRGGELLASHTVETAAQELACVVIAQAVVARVRAEAGGAAVLRVSFAKVLAVMEGVWLTLAVGVGVLSGKQEAALVRRALVYLAEVMSAPRRRRSCPRAVRQPVSSWPRLTKNESLQGEIRYEILPLSAV
jgi:hypothetical protein